MINLPDQTYFVMRIGLMSDTHGFIDDRIYEYFRACDEIWHAGDLGDVTILDTLEAFKPVRAVYGNIDDKSVQARLPEDLRFECEGFDIFMTHIGGSPPRYNPRVKATFRQGPPEIFICGHSHILRVKKDPALANMLYINPGAAGNQGFHAMKTIMRFTLSKHEIADMEAIDLGKRGALG